MKTRRTAARVKPAGAPQQAGNVQRLTLNAQVNELPFQDFSVKR